MVLIPERTLNSETVYSGKIIDVSKELVELQDGSQAHREIVHHADSVAILALDKDKNVILVKQWREPILDFSLELPAGKVDDRDRGSKINAAKRELNEELGMTCEDISFMREIHSSTGFTDESVFLYIAVNVEPVEKKLPRDKGEFLEIEKYSIYDFTKKIVAGEIKNAPTIIGGLSLSAALVAETM